MSTAKHTGFSKCRTPPRLYAGLCAAALLLASGVANAEVLVPEEEAEASMWPAAASPEPWPAQLQTREWDLRRILPEQPHPPQLQIPEEATRDELEGRYGFALTFVVFSGLVLVGSLLALFFGLMRWIWSEDAPISKSAPRWQ